MKKRITQFIILILFLFLVLLLIRWTNQREIDDVSPEITCSEELLKNSDILWIIPKFNNKSISENKEWCDYILSLNKTLGLHGVIHDYHEFETEKNQEYIQKGIDIFEQCFGFKPIIFKPPQLIISKENKQLIKENNMNLKSKINQITHKVYHCEDTGKFSNKFIDLF